MLGSGGLMGVSADENRMREDTAQHPMHSRTRTSSSALGAVAPLAGMPGTGAGGATGAGQPAAKQAPGPWARAIKQME